MQSIWVETLKKHHNGMITLDSGQMHTSNDSTSSTKSTVWTGSDLLRPLQRQEVAARDPANLICNANADVYTHFRAHAQLNAFPDFSVVDHKCADLDAILS
ncbi:hypothetical protein BO70DRAFT_425890 [Aspergillus heteromorphus CBS 117.55]|uniref:Uncharacterized protein n=1 Tax=Aspergillus heteromorphus CBS 117.55 TaxID=1448321 RepID=A0A317X334_9EURO|nr:uncharacterized protein BO70DRAFT_425890 [Aspergillus heteromorphus CBS 117.55]PWY90970.1 hypothetical protein BO70DRAFT_425890 [Aspergillus heteromorphus CBS 117.55]